MDQDPRPQYDLLFIDFLAQREREMGSDAGGLHAFYHNRLRGGRALHPYEEEVQLLLRYKLPRYQAYVEIGTGFGQLLCLLAVHGMRSVGIEKDTSRFTGLEAFRSAVCREWPEAESLISVVQDAFPCEVPGIDRSESIVLTTNLVHGADFETEQRIIDGMAQYRAALVDTVRFCRDRMTEEDQRALDSRFAAAGFNIQQPLWLIRATNSITRERYMFYSRQSPPSLGSENRYHKPEEFC